jgi:hypothetical protein
MNGEGLYTPLRYIFDTAPYTEQSINHLHSTKLFLRTKTTQEPVSGPYFAPLYHAVTAWYSAIMGLDTSIMSDDIPRTFECNTILTCSFV